MHVPDLRRLLKPLSSFSKLTAWLILGVALTATFLSWASVRSEVEREALVRFNLRVDEIRRGLAQQMLAYEQVLRGGVALFNAAGDVDRQVWHRYMRGIDIERNYPGIQGVGFARRLMPQELAEHVRRTRAEGFPEYQVRPSGKRDEYASIVYLEPYSRRNLRAFGFDMFSEPARRAAMEAARDTAEPALTGRVTLVPETETDVQTGFLMYLPVYADAAVPATVAARRQRLLGFVYSPFRGKDLLRGLLGDQLSDVELEIYDGTQADTAANLYSSLAERAKEYVNRPLFERQSRLDVNGRTWLLRVTSRPAFEASVDRGAPLLVLAGGLLVSVLFFAVTWSLATMRERALVLAGRMNAALRESEEQYRLSIGSVRDYAIVLLDRAGRVKSWNEGAQSITGYTSEDVLGRHFSLFRSPMEAAENPEHELSVAASEGRYEETGWRLRKDGTSFYADIVLTPLFTGRGEVRGFINITRDITEMVKAEEALRRARDELEKRVEVRTVELKRSNERLRDALEFNASIISNSLLGILAYRASGECVLANEAAAALVGATVDTLERQNFRQITSWQASGLLASGERALQTGQPQQIELHSVSTFGKEMWLDCFVAPFFNRGERQLLLTLVDIQAEKRAETALRESEEKYRLLVEGTNAILWEVDPVARRFTYVSPQAEALLGLPLDAWFCAEALAAHRLDDKLQVDRAVVYEYRFVAAQGRPVWLQNRLAPPVGEAGVRGQLRGIILDVTDRKAAEQALKESRERLALATRAGGVGTWDWDLRSGAMIWDEQMLKMHDAERVPEQGWRQFVSVDDIARIEQEVAAALAGAAGFDTEYRIAASQGKRHVKARGEVFRDEAGRAYRMLGTSVDISDLRAAEETIRQLAYYDPLTNLPNRRLFRERLNQALAWADRGHSLVALCYIDLDRFKHVNDTLGHVAGDALLRGVADRIAHCVREGDSVARLGGDEFAVIVNNVTHPEHAALVAEKILIALRAPCFVDGREIPTSASIGIGVYPDDTKDPDELIQKADIALYHSKESGKNMYRFYSENINQQTVERLELESGLLKAIERNELSLEYQPLMERGSNAVSGVEALLRWNHPTLGRVPPMKFIPLAEEMNIIDAIGEWALDTAFRQLKVWDDAGLAPLTLAVNFSAMQFRSGDLLEKVLGGVDRAAVAADRLVLEITETALMQNPEEAVLTIAALREAGLTVAIDDFGTGYSSLAYLQRLPVNELKIDRSFVENMTCDDGGGLAIAEAVVALARSLRLSVVAEGVETREQLDLLSRLGCDKMQGYYFSKPLAGDEVPAFLARARRTDFGIEAATTL
jgi:diguanylate cyclase (GGDEF)-like protein/PAS domain S-box-containing protein